LTDPHADYSDQLENLEEVLKEHLYCGEKLVRFYEVDKNSRAEMMRALVRIKIADSPIRDAYPILLPEGELEDYTTEPNLIAVEEVDGGVAAVFAAVRSVMLREPVPTEELPEEALKSLGSYDEIIGIRHIRNEAVDVVMVSSKSPYVTVRVDYPSGMHRDVAEAAQERIREEIATLVQKDRLTAPVNLFPLINEMYKARAEGTVVELAFGTTTASLKHERMRRHAACLREETYHKGGKAALKAPIEPYKLSIVWKIPITDGFSTPELGLYSTAATAASANPILTDAVIRKCMGESDYIHVESRIEHFISALKKKAHR